MPYSDYRGVISKRTKFLLLVKLSPMQTSGYLLFVLVEYLTPVVCLYYKCLLFHRDAF